MIRRQHLLGLSIFLGLSVSPAALSGSTLDLSPAFDSQINVEAKEQSRLIADNQSIAVHYRDDLTEQEILDRVEQDAQQLGATVVRTLILGHVAVFKGEPDLIRQRIKASEDFPVKALSTVFYPNGLRHPERMIVFTSKALLNFDPQATESEKLGFLRQKGFEVLYNCPSGKIVVETNQQPGWEMVSFTKKLKEENALVTEADFDFLMDADASFNSNSIVMQDTLYDLQWYLENTRGNTNYGFGTPDQDLDVPRAWMINQQQNKPNTYGDPNIVVGVFDTGIQLVPSHPDLVGNMDPRLGLDAQSGGPPAPANDLLGAHGTAMSGIVAATKNNMGVVGIAPGCKVYTLRVLGQDFGADLSTSSVAVVVGLDNAIFNGIDVGLHAYSLGISYFESDTVSMKDSMDNAFRQAFDSGRGGLGITNIAAAGNNYAQTSYPASSYWTISVGSVTSEKESVAQANWGGVGVDLVMPGYSFKVSGNAESFDTPFGTGIVTTDLLGAPGITSPDPQTPGNETGDYGAVGELISFTNSSSPVLDSSVFLGTSVSSAMAAGLVALMYSDDYYDEMTPFTYDGLFEPEASRLKFRNRATPRTTDGAVADNILSQLRNFADLPNKTEESFQALRSALGPEYGDLTMFNQLSYIGGYNERLGFGQPNPALFLSNFKDPGPDHGFEGMLLEQPIIEYVFGQQGPANIDLLDEAYEELKQGWAPSDNASLAIGLEGYDEPVIISPFLERMSEVYFEDGTVIGPEAGEEKVTFPYFWVDSLTTAPESSETDGSIPNLLYNPNGQYPTGGNFDLVSPDISTPDEHDYNGPYTTMPMVLTLQLAHQLSTEGYTPNSFDTEQSSTGDTTFQQEVDNIQVLMEYFYEGESGSVPVTLNLASITGDSSRSPKSPIEKPISIFLEDPLRFRNQFSGANDRAGGEYDPLYPNSEMVVRDYRFLVPPIPEGGNSFKLTLRLNSGTTTLPVWYYEEDGGEIVARQLYDAPRKSNGYIFAGMKLQAFNPDLVDYLAGDTFIVGEGFMPVWTYSQNDLLCARPNGYGGDFMVYMNTFLTYDRAADDDIIQPVIRGAVPFMETWDPITGLACHPGIEILAMTANGGGEDGIYLISPDGVNQQHAVDPSLAIGARDPSWAMNGTQLLYCSENYIRLINFLNDGRITTETILDENHADLTDFHSPVFDASAGVVYFAARRKESEDFVPDDTSLNMYVAARNGRILSYEFEDDGTPKPLIQGFEGIDIYDFNMSPSGRRMIITANAVGTPDGGYMYSENSTLLSVENIDYVMYYNNDPIIEQVALENPGDAARLSTRFGRISPDGKELTFASFNAASSIDSPSSIGQIIRQPIKMENNDDPIDEIDPTPPVTPVPPTPTPPLMDNAQVSLVGEITFDATPEAWVFNPGGYTDNPLLHRYEQVASQPKEVESGVIGFYTSSSDVIVSGLAGADLIVVEMDFLARRDATLDFAFSTSAPQKTQAYDYLLNPITTEIGAPISKDLSTRQAEPVMVYYRVMEPVSAPTVTQGQLVKLRVYVDPNGNPMQVLEGYVNYDPTVLIFQSGVYNDQVFDLQKSKGALTLQSDDSNMAFGYWETLTTQIHVQEDALYLCRAQVSATQGVLDAEVPTLRMRVNSNNLESAYTVVTDSEGDYSLSPVTSEIRAVDLLFRPPTSIFNLPIDKRDYRISFDLLNFFSYDDPSRVNDPNGGIMLHEIEIYRLDDARKYQALWGFRMPDGGGMVTFRAANTSGVKSNLAMSLRTCCSDSSTDEFCVEGLAQSGLTLTTDWLSAGYYTLVATSDDYQELLLTWDATTSLIGELGDECGEVGKINTDPNVPCANRVLLSGNGHDPDDYNMLLTSIQTMFYDGMNYFPSASCDTKENQTVVKSQDAVYEVDFTDRADREAWASGPPVSPYKLPEFLLSDDALSMRVLEQDLTFGYWTADGETIPTGSLVIDEDSPVVIYRATFRTSVETAVNVDPLSIPDLRFRLGIDSHQRSVSGLLISVHDGATVPVPGYPRETDVYMVLEQVPDSLNSLIAAFDVLSFYPEEYNPGRVITDVPINLEYIRIERINIPNYPAPR